MTIFNSDDSPYGKTVNNLDNNPELTKEVALEIVRQDAWNFVELPIRFRNDKEIVIAAVNPQQPKGGDTGNLLKYASEELRNDKEVVLEAVRGRGYGGTEALKYASEELRNNKEVVLEAVKHRGPFGGDAIQYASKELRNDREIVLAAVQTAGWNLEFVAPHFQDDIEIVRAAIKQDANSLEYASPRFRNDREFVLTVVKQLGEAIMHASPRFDDDKEIVLAALNAPRNSYPIYWPDEDGKNLRYIVYGCMSRRLREDPDVNGDGNNNYITFPDASPLMQKFQNLLYWREWKELKKRREEGWQEKYGSFHKERLERWQRDLVQWQQNQKDVQFEGYNGLRKEIEKMPAYQNWRKAVFERFGRKCAMCGSTENLEIDHRKSFYSIVKHHGITNIVQAYECVALWDVNNGAPLCKTHHDQTATSRYRAERL